MIPDQALNGGIEKFTHRIYTQENFLNKNYLIILILRTLSIGCQHAVIQGK
jgi:hypothetical protein